MLSDWTGKKSDGFFFFSIKTILVVTQSKIMNLKMDVSLLK